MTRPVADPAPCYRLTLEALPGELDADYRVRRALKVLLRRFGLRCRHLELVARERP